MPKITNTRKEKANRLMVLLQRGPAFQGMDVKACEEAKNAYRIWSQSWIIPLVEELVPELRKKIGGV